ncbi:HAD family hydrolase [Patescibacteria group bacterium]|nr:HAD family hydrolase [Patescibacteria group bacterium]
MKGNFNMGNKLILFDIDHTLLNTTKMVSNFTNLIIKKSNLTEEEVIKLTSNYTSSLPHVTYFDFTFLIQTLNLADKQTKQILSEYKNNFELYPKYDQVNKVLSELNILGYSLGIFSEGVPSFQINKLKNLKIDEFIENQYTYITQSKRSESFLSSLPKSVIVDDNIDIVNLINNHGKHYPIHINRKGKLYTIEKSSLIKGITSINSLSELVDILVK